MLFACRCLYWKLSFAPSSYFIMTMCEWVRQMCECVHICYPFFFLLSSRKMVIKRFQLEVVVEGGKVCSTYSKKSTEHKTWEWVRPTFHIKVIKNDGEKSILQLFFSLSLSLTHNFFILFEKIYLLLQKKRLSHTPHTFEFICLQ